MFLAWAVLWCKWSFACLSPLGSRDHITGTPCGFHGEEDRVWVDFSRCFSSFSLSQISFHHTHLIHFISFTPVMMHQLWSARILVIHRISLKRASSHDPALCQTWVENIYFIFYRKVVLWYACTLYMSVCQWKFLLQDCSIHKYAVHIPHRNNM